MKQLSKYKMIALASIFLPQVLSAQTEKENPFIFEASYVGDVVGNFAGGIKTGAAYLGMANLKMGFDTKKAGWWKGGELFVNGGNTHGGEPSATLIGDFQAASNIEAGNHTYLFELWYRQTIGKVSITAGLQDLNADYAASEGGSLFNNSYFGIHSVCSDNISVPIFPLTALGLNVGWDIAEDYRWQAVVFDGTSYGWDANPYNVKWSLSAEDGFFAVTEFHLGKSLVKGKNGKYKLGAYLHRSEMMPGEVLKNYGFYFVGDQEITNQLSLFTQIGFSPKKYNNHFQCYGLGATLKNFSSQRPDDNIGLAANYAIFKENEAGNEMVIELIYHFQVSKNIYLRPDIQYIINPAGTDKKLNNALVGMLRFGIEF
ncbi:hypothetical protein AGMMS4956_00040 [Bacteroidia bacterium]|nr:hypothetical protein AGMMS4956_00040 [Bacteroidia bacterium]